MNPLLNTAAISATFTGRADMHAWPKFGASYQTAMTHPDVVPAEWAAMLVDAGCDFTRIWCYDAWAIGSHGPGQYEGYVPWLRDAEGVFDLDAPNEAYYERLHEFVEAMNAAGITVQLTVLELYGWSARKQGRSGCRTRTSGRSVATGTGAMGRSGRPDVRGATGRGAETLHRTSVSGHARAGRRV